MDHKEDANRTQQLVILYDIYCLTLLKRALLAPPLRIFAPCPLLDFLDSTGLVVAQIDDIDPNWQKYLALCCRASTPAACAS